MLFFEIPHFFRYFWLGEESQSENRIFLMKYFLTEVTTIVLEGIQFSYLGGPRILLNYI